MLLVRPSPRMLQKPSPALVLVLVVILVLAVWNSIWDSILSSNLYELSTATPFQKCGCTEMSRANAKLPSFSTVHQGQYRFNSTCSDQRTHSQPNQNVTSFSLFLSGTDEPSRRLYLNGIQRNLGAMREYYPSYSMRIFTNQRPDAEFCSLICHYPNLFWCDVRETPSLGDLSAMFYMSWRFLPLGDPTVDIFLSRDLDSVITAREAAVVRDWLQSNDKKGIHAMRDKDAHGIPMLGGMWGARNSLLGNKSVHLQERIVRSNERDQVTLSKVVFGLAYNDIVAYDSYHCTKSHLQKSLIRPFPTQRQAENGTSKDFVGNCCLGEAVYEFKPCPVECRPSYGKNWTYC